jgi:hypothetical protein
MKRAGLAATIKARWICEQAHQQLKEKLGLDHFEGRSWQGLHRHALMTMIAYAFLQHRHLTQVGRKKESTDRRLSLACRPYATPSSISFFDHYLSNAHTAEDEAVKNSGVGKSAKVVLGLRDCDTNWWTHKGSNLGPLPCEGNALPLSYASGIFLRRIVRRKSGAGAGIRVVRGRDLRSAACRCQAAVVNSCALTGGAFSQNTDLLKRINVIWGVQSRLQK